VGSAEDEETVEYIEEILESIAEGIGSDAAVEVRDGGEVITAEYVGDELAPLIGEHGVTIDAIQHLTQRIAFHGLDTRRPLVVDAAGYRAQRAQALHAVADQAAQAAVRERRPVSLEAMGAQERKVVHEHLKARFDVKTYSEGQEPSRHLVIAPLVD
jgi:spoIIIJ-associated protein